MAVGPLYEEGESIHPKVYQVLQVGKQDHLAQLDYLETSAAPPLMTELDKLTERQFDRSAVQIAYYSYNMFMEGFYRRHQLQQELRKKEQLANDMAADLNRVKEELVRVAEEKRLADDALKTAEARQVKLQQDLAAVKEELVAAKNDRNKELQERVKAESNYEKLRTALPTIASKVLASAEVQEPFIRLVVAAQDCGSSRFHKALVDGGVALPDQLPGPVNDLLKQDCEDRFNQAGEDLKVVKATFIDEIGGPIPVPVENILERLS
jgi:hypothetical protein